MSPTGGATQERVNARVDANCLNEAAHPIPQATVDDFVAVRAHDFSEVQ